MAERDVAPRLGEFLRARRALVRPEDHGMPTGTRRTSGLRREEVAMLAGVSTDYYIRLEQGRDKHPSPQVVQALAGALLLGDEAAAYLRGLAEPGPSRRPRPGPPGVRRPGADRADGCLGQHPRPWSTGGTWTCSGPTELGSFRTGFLSADSVRLAGKSIRAYAGAIGKFRAAVQASHGHQPGDPVRAVAAVRQLAATPEPPLRPQLGSDCVSLVESKLATVARELSQWRDLALSTNFKTPQP